MSSNDVIKEAIDLGILSDCWDSDEKKLTVISFRVPHGIAQLTDSYAGTQNLNRSDVARDCLIAFLTDLKRKHEYLSKVFDEATNTKNTTYSRNSGH